MLKHSEYMVKITEKLSMSAFIIKFKGMQAQFDDHKYMEVFYRELLNMVFNYQLENAKTNQPGYDLIDKKNYILFQVTAEDTKTKVNDTIKKINKISEEYKGYNLKFMIISERDSKLKNGVFDDVKIVFNPKNDIVDLNYLVNQIGSLPLDRIEDVLAFIDKSLPLSNNSVVSINNNLYEVVKAIAMNYVEEESVGFEELPMKFKIEDKIRFNDLIDCYATISDLSGYHVFINNIYEQQAREGNTMFERVLRKIQREYRDIIVNNESYSSNKIFHELCERITNQILLDDRLKDEFDRDVLEECVEIIVVDAFIKCKIFKRPEDSIYDTSY